MANFWSLPLKFAFAHPHFTLVLSESRAEALGLLARFRNDFLLVMLVSLSVVILLSLNQIRKNLVPLEKIREGTRRIAMQDFTARVEVSSGDEFEEVARSFNAMAGRLARQFRALAAMNEIDRSILSVLDAEKIVQTVLTRARIAALRQRRRDPPRVEDNRPGDHAPVGRPVRARRRVAAGVVDGSGSRHAV